MADVLPSSRRNNVGQLKLSTARAAVAAPPSPNRAKLKTTARKALSSLKASTNRAKRLYFEDIPHRIKCYMISARDDTDVGRSHRPHQQHSINHGPNNGLRYDKPISIRGASTGHYSLCALQDSKSSVPESPFTRSVTPPQPALKVLHFGHLSVIKTKEPTRQLLASKYFKNLPTFLAEILRGTANGNITVRRPEKKGWSLSHESAIPIPLNDVLLRSLIPTNSRAICGRRDGPVLEGLIGVGDIDITPLRLWDDADSQVSVDVDGKDVSSKSPAPEEILVPKVPSFKLLESIPECPDETHEQCGSSTTTPPLSDTPEGEPSRGSGSGSFNATGNGGATPFEGQSSSPSRGKDTENQDQSVLAVDYSEDSPTDYLSPLPFLCWHAAAGLPCCNGKGHTATEFRRLWGDHYCSKNTPNHHLLYKECPRCKRLFVDERSWAKHDELFQSPSSCGKLSHRDLQVQNDQPNRKGITKARKKEVEKAIEKYTKDGTVPGDKKNEHNKWVDDNCKDFIGQSSTTEVVARLELGKWLVAWYIIFPGVKIPSNPFTVTIAHQELLGRVYGELANQARMGTLPYFDEKQCSLIAEIFQKGIGQWQLEHLQAAQTPKTRRQPPNSSTAKRQLAKRPAAKPQLGKRKAIKRQKIAEPEPTQAQLEPTMSPPAQPPSFVVFGQDPRFGTTASSSYTPDHCDVFSYVGSTPTDPTSYNDNGAPYDGNDPLVTVPKVSENGGQSRQGEWLEPSPMDLIFLETQHIRQISPQNALTDPYFPGIRDQATLEATFVAALEAEATLETEATSEATFEPTFEPTYEDWVNEDFQSE